MSREKDELLRRLAEAITDLYLHVKVRTSEEIANFTEDKYQKEKMRLDGADPFMVLGYIKSTVEIIMNLRVEDEGKASMTQKSEVSLEPPKDYEQMVQKLEAEVRNHIRVEHQLKLQIESLQLKIEEQELRSEKYLTKIKQTTEEMKQLKEKPKKSFNHSSSQGKLKNIVEGEPNCGRGVRNVPVAINLDLGRAATSRPKAGRKEEPTNKETQDQNVNNSSSSSRVINAPKGIGINEQNIYQIICKTSDHLKDGNQYLAEFYKSKLGEKTKEVSQLRSQLRTLKSSKASSSRNSARKTRSVSFAQSLNASHRRSKSQRKLCGESQRGGKVSDLFSQQQMALTDPRKITNLKNKMDLISRIISKRTSRADHNVLTGSGKKPKNESSAEKSRKLSAGRHKSIAGIQKGYMFPPSTTFARLIDADIETVKGKKRRKGKKRDKEGII